MSMFNLNLIKEKWKELENEPNVFQYNLKVVNRKCLQGNFQFYCELNPDRSKLRRIPQVIPSLSTSFDPNKFNFNKIKPNEWLLDIPFEDIVVTFIVNQSPLTPYHSLICPDLKNAHPQRINETALKFCVEFLLTIDDQGFRIGYNSPGALASVNHLHLHLMYMDYDLYIDNALLEAIIEGRVYRLAKTMPTEAICFVLDEDSKQAIVKLVFELIEYLCKRNIPHNILITPDRTQSLKSLKLFIYAREKHSVIKDLTALNVAFCEFSGYIPVGDIALYDSLSEERIVEKIRAESGSVYHLIYKYLINL